MENVKICPACKRENRASESICTYCGTPLVGLLPQMDMARGMTTEPVPDAPVKVKHPDHIIQLTKLYADIVVLTVLGQEQPILIKGGGRIVLGRYSPGEVAPSVDLTPYNAGLLGVSRQHAVITRPEKTYLLQDLGSTNGTWLNEVKLTPNKTYTLQSGDLIRVGQLALYVYFDTPKPDEIPTVEIVLQKDNDKQLTANDMSKLVVPYLQALAGMQKICDSILERSGYEMSILELSFDQKASKIHLKLNNAAEAVRMTKTKLAAPIPVHQPTVANTVSIPASTEAAAQATSHVNGEENGTKDNHSYAKIAMEILDDLAPFRSEEFKKDTVEKLLPFIKELTASPLHIVIDQ